MRLVVTGGGTGGHVYPALVVAEELRRRGVSLMYLGSLRGQEARACERAGIDFLGYLVEPMYSPVTARGRRSLWLLVRAQTVARRALRDWKPDAVFSTGGYSAGPTIMQARRLGIPLAVHEANSVPGKANRLFGKNAWVFTTVFRSTERFVSGFPLVRTGQPIRPALRSAASESRISGPPTVLVLGGSQGSEFLNGLVPRAAALMEGRGVRFIHATGPANIGAMQARLSALDLSSDYDARGYLETPELVDAYRNASLAVCRSGGTLAELALFGLPSVLCPLPTSADDHQLHNAEEFQDMNAATILRQETATPERLAEQLGAWIDDPAKREVAAERLKEWDMPRATETIADLVEQAMSGAVRVA